MVRAMDRSQRKSALLTLATIGLLAAPGCSGLRGGRFWDIPKAGASGDPGTDPYLAHHAKPARGGPETVLAGRDEPVRPIDPDVAETVVRSTAHPIAVTLEAPVALKIASAEPGPAPLRPESRSDDGREVLARSRKRLESMATYQVRLTRQERVGDTLHPSEEVLLSIRREPKAVRIEWPTGPHKGREVIFSTSDPSGQLHVNMADAIVPAKLSFAPDSPLITRTSRHPISEAGFAAILDGLDAGLADPSAGATIAYRGVETPESVGRPCHAFHRKSKEGEDWLVYLDLETELPAMVKGTAANGDLLESDLFRDVRPDVPELASAAAFDPTKRWGGGPLGLIPRLARSGGDSAGDDPSSPR